MKIAIIAVTDKGMRQACGLAGKMGDCATVYVKAGRSTEQAVVNFSSLSQLLADIFNRYDGLVFIMAAGIAVRVIAPHIQDKRFDPAVVVMDDCGKHAISLLSGHIGGANDLAVLIGKLTGAEPVITTATDVSNQTAADVVAVKLGLVVEPIAQLKQVNATIANGGHTAFFIDGSMPESNDYIKQAAAVGIALEDISEAVNGLYDAAVLITQSSYSFDKPHVYLRQADLVAGIGCRRGTSRQLIMQALEDACRKIGRSPASIARIGSSIVKQNEQGLLETARMLAADISFFTNEQIKQCIILHNLTESKFVEAQIGVGNVCEAAALLAGKNSKLIVSKTKYQKVTVAIAAVI